MGMCSRYWWGRCGRYQWGMCSRVGVVGICGWVWLVLVGVSVPPDGCGRYGGWVWSLLVEYV